MSNYSKMFGINKYSCIFAWKELGNINGLKINIMTNTSILKTFEFTGSGNFSTDFEWDNGLTCNLGKQVSFSLAVKADDLNRENTGFSCKMPDTIQKGVYCVVNSHGGSRSAYGYVVANSRKDASDLLEIYLNN